SAAPRRSRPSSSTSCSLQLPGVGGAPIWCWLQLYTPGGCWQGTTGVFQCSAGGCWARLQCVNAGQGIVCEVRHTKLRSGGFFPNSACCTPLVSPAHEPGTEIGRASCRGI